MNYLVNKLLTDKNGKSKAFKLRLTDFQTHDRTLIIGKTGSGKSVLFDQMINHFSKKTFVLLLDTKREYHHVPTFEMENLEANKGLFRCYELDYRGHIIDDNYEIAEFFSILLFERAREQKKSSILAIEELGNVIKKYGRLYDIMPKFAKLLQQGRSSNIGFIGTTQRPQEIHTTILSQCTQLICFDLTSSQDLHSVKAYFEPEWFDLLNKHQFFHLNYTKNSLKRCFKRYLTSDEKNFYTKIFGKSY